MSLVPNLSSLPSSLQKVLPGGPSLPSTPSVPSATDILQSRAVAQEQENFNSQKDWRVRLSLAPEAEYLYRAKNPGILAPLAETNGVIFPYTPSINTVYSASYDSQAVTHSNYLIHHYTNSSVDTVNIVADFTAQDTFEANYLLATIHFFKSVTKMFYGQDQNPKNGTPPPLVYMFGLGGFQFDSHPLAVINFQYSLPTDVDYIKTTNAKPAGTPRASDAINVLGRLSGMNLEPGGVGPRASFSNTSITDETTYVPTQIKLNITCLPIVSRNDISNRFSLKEYATGKLVQGTKNSSGGIW